MELNNPFKKSVAGFFLIALCLAILVVLFWLEPENIKSQIEAINSERQLIIHSSSHGYFLGIVLCLLLFLSMLIYVMPTVVRGKELTKKQKSFTNKYFIIPFVISFALMFVFHFVLNSYYRQQMTVNGYQRCPDTALLFARVTYSAWVKDPVLCHDSDVRRIVRRGYWEESFQVEQMLEQRIQREEARVQRQQREAERQEARRQREALEREQG